MCYYSLITDGYVHSLHMIDETSNLPTFIHKILDLEEADTETLHLLVFLLMQFLSRQDQVDVFLILNTKSVWIKFVIYVKH